MVRRILDRRTIALYAGFWLLLWTATPERRGAMELLGGFVPRESRGLNILGIIRWNLCVLPPVAASILFMDAEMGALRIYTMIRSENVRKWFLPRLMGIAAANLVYPLLFAGLAAVAGSGDYKRDGFGIFLAVFFLHSFLMSTVSVVLCGKSGRVHAAVVFYLFAEGILVVVGNLFPRTAACLPPYWGMIRQVEDGGAGYFLGILGVSAAGIAASAVFAIKSLRA